MRYAILPILLLSPPVIAQSTQQKSPYNETVMRNGDHDMGRMRWAGEGIARGQVKRTTSDQKECLYHRTEHRTYCMTRAQWVDYAARLAAADK